MKLKGLALGMILGVGWGLIPWVAPGLAAPGDLPLAEARLLAEAAAAPQAQEWQERRNSDLGDGQRLGWKLRLPANWVVIPDVNPGWPVGAGWRTPDGQTSLVVTCLERVPPEEFATLRARRYLESSQQCAGVEGHLFRKINGPSFEQVLYLPKGSHTYRLLAVGITRDKATLESILESFSFLSESSSSQPSTTYQNANLGLSLRLPEPTGWEAKPSAKGVDLYCAQQKVISIRPRSVTPQPGQSFRGLARQMGKTYIAQAQSLTRFEPYQAAGLTGYLAVWQTGEASYAGPILYLPYKRGQNNVLELEVLDPQFLEQFFKVVSSLQLGGGGD